MNLQHSRVRGVRTILVVGLLAAATPPTGSTAVAAADGSVKATTSVSTSDSFAERAGWIAFQSYPSVRVIRTDGTGDRIVTPVPAGSQQHPDWSPDGSTIAFDVDDTAIWVVGFHGERPRKVHTCTAPCLWVSEPAWSPDGTEIAFTRYSVKADGETARRSVVAAVDVRSGKVRILHRVRRGTDIPFTPRWSPGGRRIVFEEDRFVDDDKDTSETVGSRLVVARADGSGRRNVLTTFRFGALNVDWGRRGIVTSRAGNLWTMRPNGSHRARITDLDDVTAHAIQPTWTPGGGRVTFTYVRGQFGVDDQPTVGFVRARGEDFTAWAAGGDRITHPRVRP